MHILLQLYHRYMLLMASLNSLEFALFIQPVSTQPNRQFAADATLQNPRIFAYPVLSELSIESILS
jgi:hypothetical protein